MHGINTYISVFVTGTHTKEENLVVSLDLYLLCALGIYSLVWGSTLSGVRFRIWICTCLSLNVVTLWVYSLGLPISDLELHTLWGYTLSSGGLLSRVTDFGSGSVIPLLSGEPEAAGTGDRKTVRCPSIDSCMILMQTLRSGDPLSRVTDFWGSV